MKHSLPSFPLLATFFLAASFAHATPVNVNSTDVIYGAGSQSGLAAALGGTVPGFIAVNSSASYFSFSVNGFITLNVGTGNNPNNPDGFGSAAGTSSNSGYGSLSGIAAPGAGYLTGVFVGSGGPSGSAPVTLNFNTGTGTAFASLTPLLDQVFFIGDGLTGNGIGASQKFYIPTGATKLYLGISDACGYNGGPSCYTDNSGQFSANYAVVNSPVVTGATPEPSSLLLMGTGLVGLSMYLTLRREGHRSI